MVIRNKVFSVKIHNKLLVGEIIQPVKYFSQKPNPNFVEGRGNETRLV